MRADSSPEAAELADLLAAQEPRSRPRAARRRRAGRAAYAMLASVGLALGVAGHGYAATPSLEGRWAMAGASSSFNEALTGAAPDTATVVVTRDDGQHLAYQVSEMRQGVEVARAKYNISFNGAASTSQVGETVRAVTADRDARGDVVIRAPSVGSVQALIRFRRVGANAAVLEHVLDEGGQSVQLEQIYLIRADTQASN